MSTSGETAGRPRGIFVVLHAIVLLLLLAFSRTYEQAGFTFAELVYPMCVVLTVLSAWLLWTWRRVSGSLFDPYGMFLIAAILFNAGQAILETFDLNAEGLLKNQFPSETLFQALLLTTIGLAAFHLGGLLNVVLASRRPRGPSPSEQRSDIDYAAFRFVGWGLFAISVVPAVILARSAVSLVASAGYTSLYQRDVAAGAQAAPQLLAGFLVPAAILILLGAEGSPAQVRFTAAVILAFSAVQFFLGTRATAVMPIAAYAWTYHRTVRPIPRAFLLSAGAILLFVVFPLVRAVRVVTGEDRLSPSFLWRSYVSIDNPVVAIVAEVGGSMNTTAWTTTLVPSFRPYDMGAGYLYALSTVFPNVFGGIHPAVERGTAGAWLVTTVSPFTAASGGGFGYSFIAEAYLNFGWTGSAAILLLIGFGFSNIFYRSIRSADPRLVGLSACFFAFLSLYARGESTSVARPLLWYSALPMLAVVLLSRRQLKAPRRRVEAAIRGPISPGGRPRPIDPFGTVR